MTRWHGRRSAPRPPGSTPRPSSTSCWRASAAARAGGCTKTGGILDTRAGAASSGLRDLTRRLDDLDARLSRRESQLRRQFTAMETALQRTRSQNTDLAMRLRWGSS